MNNKKLPQWIVLACTILCSILWLGSPAHAASPMQNYVDAMQPGINLGNTLDAIPDETSWGNPPVTQALMQQYAAAGYKSVRIPITWTNHMGPAPMYTVDPAWMNRVQQVVDWALDAGLHVMINAHHDSWQWISAMPTNHDVVLIRFTAVWTQIAERFAGYPNTLMFESVNEPQFAGVDEATGRTLIDELNTTFFDVVRSSGGMNTTRPLVLPCLHTTAGQENLDSLAATIAKLNDPNLITTTHFYGFWPFSVNIMGYTKFNSPTIDNIIKSFDAVYNTFVAKGIPSILGEFGVLNNRQCSTGRGSEIPRVRHAIFPLEAHRAYVLGYRWFDRPDDVSGADPDLHGTMMQTLKGRATNADTDSIFVNSGEEIRNATINLNLNGNNFVSLSEGSTTLKQGVDYKIEGSVLTIKKERLATYASAPFGQKAILAVKVSSGPAWNINVHYTSSPELSPASGTTGGNLVIPTAFNGDVLATMEARRADGSPAGPANWTAFKEWGVYLPNYTNNTITITDNFFTGEPAGTINLKFHFWSGRVATYELTLQSGGSSGGEDLTIYENSLAPGWQSWSWATVNFANATAAHSAPNSISVDAGPWGSLYLAYQGAAPGYLGLQHADVLGQWRSQWRAEGHDQRSSEFQRRWLAVVHHRIAACEHLAEVRDSALRARCPGKSEHHQFRVHEHLGRDGADVLYRRDQAFASALLDGTAGHRHRDAVDAFDRVVQGSQPDGREGRWQHSPEAKGRGAQHRHSAGSRTDLPRARWVVAEHDPGESYRFDCERRPGGQPLHHRDDRCSRSGPEGKGHARLQCSEAEWRHHLHATGAERRYRPLIVSGSLGT